MRAACMVNTTRAPPNLHRLSSNERFLLSSRQAGCVYVDYSKGSSNKRRDLCFTRLCYSLLEMNGDVGFISSVGLLEGVRLF
jgi:hypothetical protein